MTHWIMGGLKGANLDRTSIWTSRATGEPGQCIVEDIRLVEAQRMIEDHNANLIKPEPPGTTKTIELFVVMNHNGDYVIGQDYYSTNELGKKVLSGMIMIYRLTAPIPIPSIEPATIEVEIY